MTASPTRRPVSIRDVAQAAGVSMQTVSRVVHDYPQVNPATRARVKAAMLGLGYRPNPAARSLVTGRSQLIGVVITDFDDHHSVQLLTGLESEAADAGYDVIVVCAYDTTLRDARAAVSRLLEHPLDGVVLLAGAVDDAVTTLGLPTNLPSIVLGHSDHSDIWSGERDGAYLAVEHLLELGHRQVWHISGPPHCSHAHHRETGWRGALRERDLQPPAPIAGDWTATSGYTAARALTGNPAVTAVFAANDAMAVGAIAAFRDAGRRIPHDISITGFGNDQLSPFTAPALTTVAYDYQQEGRRAITALQQLIEPEHTDPRPLHTARWAQLLIRDSATTAPDPPNPTRDQDVDPGRPLRADIPGDLRTHRRPELLPPTQLA